jgi:hypothetical protein
MLIRALEIGAGANKQYRDDAYSSKREGRHRLPGNPSVTKNNRKNPYRFRGGKKKNALSGAPT